MENSEREIRLDVFTRQPVLEAGLRCVLSPSSGVEICAVHNDIGDLVGDLVGQPPGLLLFDYTPEMNAATLAEIRRCVPACKVVVWVQSITTVQANYLTEIGVRGIIYKEMPVAILQNCLATVARGETWIQRELMNDLLEVKRVRLSRRELQLLCLVSEGLGNKQIAYQLDLNEGTVKVYLSKLFRKLEVRDRFELALFGLKHLGFDHGQMAVNGESGDSRWLRSAVIASPRGPFAERGVPRREFLTAGGSR